MIHSRTAEADQAALAWVDRFGFCSTPAKRSALARIASADFYGRFAPVATDDGLAIAVSWVYWGFAFDDEHCDAGPLSADPAGFIAMTTRLQRVLEVPHTPPPGDPFAAALHDLGQRMRAFSTPVKVRRFVEAHRAWLSGVQWQVANRASGVLPDLNSYVTMRLHSCGGEPTYALLEIANDLPDLPGQVRDAQPVQALTEMATMVAALDNDLFSFSKEQSLRQTGQNICTVLAAVGNRPARAFDPEAIALRDLMLARFLALRDEVLAVADPLLRRYLLDLGHGIRGNAEWSCRTARYLGNETVDLVEMPPPSIDIGRPQPATDDHPELSALPSFAWWWDDLASSGSAFVSPEGSDPCPS